MTSTQYKRIHKELLTDQPTDATLLMVHVRALAGKMTMWICHVVSRLTTDDEGLN